MQYDGKYGIFNVDDIVTYPLSERTNKVTIDDIVRPDGEVDIDLPLETKKDIDNLASDIVSARKNSRPVILFTGAHAIKNGLGKLLIKLVEKNMVTLIAGNGATAIHDFELALIGQTSEHVPNALEKGGFGMAYEFAYINEATVIGNKQNLGLGEALGKAICDESFWQLVLKKAANEKSPKQFDHPEISLLAACYKNDVPMTIHVGIGTDVTDQHKSFDPAAKGAASGRDFLIYTNECAKLVDGGVILNIASAVTGPEVLLKAISMAANVGKRPKKIITADFDLRNFRPEHMANEQAQNYYFRDQKSIVTRVPKAFGGTGTYIQGNQKQTVPYLYKKIVELL